MKHDIKREIGEFVGVGIGVSLTALALVWFLIPNKIAAGGVSGLATVVFYVMAIPVGLTMFAINVPLFIATVKVLGLKFGAKTLFGAVTISVMVDVLGRLIKEPLTHDPLLASIYGGALAGLGMGIAFRYGGSTAGTDLAAQLLHRLAHISVGKALLVIDFSIIALAGIVFSPELALYALIALFVTSKVIDLIQEGGVYAKAAYIISNHPEAIAKAVLEDMERGVTALRGRGMYSGVERDVLLVIVARSEISNLKAIVAEADPSAFMIIHDVHEVLGEGFSRMSPSEAYRPARRRRK